MVALLDAKAPLSLLQAVLEHHAECECARLCWSAGHWGPRAVCKPALCNAMVLQSWGPRQQKLQQRVVCSRFSAATALCCAVAADAPGGSGRAWQAGVASSGWNGTDGRAYQSPGCQDVLAWHALQHPDTRVLAWVSVSTREYVGGWLVASVTGSCAVLSKAGSASRCACTLVFLQQADRTYVLYAPVCLHPTACGAC